MNMRDELMALREKAINSPEKIAAADARKIQTEAFFRLAKQRLRNKFNSNPEVERVSESFYPQDLDLIRNLYENRLLDEEYLKSLCESEGIDVNILGDGTWYPSFTFTINLVEKEKSDNKHL